MGPLIIRDAGDATHDFEDGAEFFEFRVADFDFVANTSQERFIDQVLRLQVCSENDELVKRNVKFYSGIKK